MTCNMNSGYAGYRMSQRAVQAYEDGEKPISKWTKKEILNAVEKINEKITDKLSSVSLEVLKDELLYLSSWHHTSGYCNKTDFYSLDVDRVAGLTDKEIEKMRQNHAKLQSAPCKSYTGTIHYLEWSGTRNHPKAKEIELKNVQIEERGKFYHVYDQVGNFLLKKKIGSRGTTVIQENSTTEVE